MTPPVPSVVHRPVRLGPEALTPETWTALEFGLAVARADVAVLAVSGPGAVACLQGLLTTDLEKPGDDAFIYGALLTAKGMIVVDGWAARHGTTVTYTTPVDVAERALALLQHALPPRLARVTDLTGEVAVFRLVGPRALVTAEAAGLAPPPVASESRAQPGNDAWGVARPTEAAPFTLQITAPAHEAGQVAARLAAAGAVAAHPLVLEATRILAGWPRVGAETDDKTIPQEIRFDEIGGVSYTKGCYTGQETVSRVHFRGHPNRTLRGLQFDEAPEAERADVVRGDRDVGRVTSLLWTPGDAAGWLGLAVVRREVEPGAVVHAAGRDARVVDLPFRVPLGPPNTTARA